jgi:PKD repeat protein
VLAFNPAIGVAASGEASPPKVSGVVSIASSPPGASVYLDGQFAGQTPLSLSRISAGDHRVRLEKDGYLENGRIVSVAAERSYSLQVTLTRGSGAAETATQVNPVSGGGGGSKKWLWAAVGGGAAAAVVAVVVVKNKNKPPVAGPIVFSPNETGLAAATPFAFSSPTSSDPDGNSLSYKWDFGDGSTATDAAPTHTYASAGDRTVTLTVNDGKVDSPAVTTTVHVRDLTGGWNGLMSTSTFVPNLTQNGNQITGTFTATFGCVSQTSLTGNITGNVSAPKTVNLTVSFPGCTPLIATGTVDGGVNNMSGTQGAGGFGTLTWSLSRR